MLKWLFPRLCLFSLLSGCNNFPALSAEKLTGFDGKAIRFFYDSQGGNVEAFLSRPRGNDQFPLIVLLHGHSWVRSGAKQTVKIAEQFSRELCYASLAISLPGYGSTVVPGSDTDGDVIARVVLDGIAKATELSWVDRRRIMLYGFSRGASFAANVAGRIPGLRSVVLHSGAYDLFKLYQNTPNEWLRRLMNPSPGATPSLFDVLAEAPSWTAPTLILHGARDDVIPPVQATLLHDRLHSLGKPHRLVMFPEAGHNLSPIKVKGEVVAFLQRHVGSGCLSDL